MSSSFQKRLFMKPLLGFRCLDFCHEALSTYVIVQYRCVWMKLQKTFDTWLSKRCGKYIWMCVCMYVYISGWITIFKAYSSYWSFSSGTARASASKETNPDWPFLPFLEARTAAECFPFRQRHIARREVNFILGSRESFTLWSVASIPTESAGLQ